MDSEVLNSSILNMCNLNSTFPEIPHKVISRDSYLDLFEEQFQNTRVLCVDGNEGVGVTTTLALFALRHPYNCISYFNNGFLRSLLMVETIEFNIGRQLKFYVTGNIDKNTEDNILQPNIYRAARKSKRERKFLYFVFDGFDELPIENRDIIKQLISPLFQIENARFIFSGQMNNVMYLIPEGINAKQTNDILRFQPIETSELLTQYIPSITNEQTELFYALSNGNAEKINILLEKYQIKNDINIISYLYTNNIVDYYEDDWNTIIKDNETNRLLFWALLVYSEIQLDKSTIGRLLGLSEDVISLFLNDYSNYLIISDKCVKIKSISFHKYLRKKLQYLKNNIDLLLIDIFEKDENISSSFQHLPYLYKSINNKSALVNFLTSENVQHFLIEKKSQAALNEQCEYGFNACTDYNSQINEYFRFALTHSSSKEIEKNELSDSEIEALIAIGDEEKAFTLTQEIFLLEERLKGLLIVARKGNKLPDNMQEEVKSQIKYLVNVIDFEHIPDKAIELAKLMLPVDFVEALSIIDKVAKVSKDKSQIDKLYTAISLSYNSEEGIPNDNPTKSDIINTRIADDGLRKMAVAMKSIMADSTVEQLLIELEKLPTASSKLFFLQFWIPNHNEADHIQDIVKYAVKLAIEVSNINIPRVSLLYHFCTPLYRMEKDDILQVVKLLDAGVSLIKYPTIDYVNLQLNIIKALNKFDKDAAKDRLQNLYLELDEVEDKNIEIHCKSIILNQFENIGDKKDIENWLMPAFELQKELTDEIIKQFSIAAYHMKVVEGPIKELVCKYPSTIFDIISKMNTEARKSRAYLLAATEYVRQTNIEKIDWEYFNKLFYKISLDKFDLDKPLIILVRNAIRFEKDTQLIFNIFKKNYDKIKNIEVSSSKCYLLSLIYVWIKNNFPSDNFADQVKSDLENTWENIDIPWIKVEVGYEISKQLSKISMKEEARSFINKTGEFRKNQLLSSYSCVAAYHESLSLYIHSLGILIRSKLCEEEDLEQFKNLLSYDDSEGEAMIAWSRLALEYYLADDSAKFHDVVSRYVSKPINKFSIYHQKRILFNIAPALFLAGSTLFYERLKSFDNAFIDQCIENVASFIRVKYPYPEYTDSHDIQSQNILSFIDYENLLNLLDHSNDDCFIFNYVDIIIQSLKEGSGNRVSKEQKNVIIGKIEELVNRKLPINNGIQHDGYKIACQAAISGYKNISSSDWDNYKNKIENIPNVSDQAFLYTYVAHNIKKASQRIDFLNQSVQKAEQINSGFDRLNRFDICLSEAFDTTNSQAKPIAEKAMQSLMANRNGSFDDFQKFINIVREHDEQLAYEMLDVVDKDPARSQYKKRLKKDIASNKKLDSARQDIKQVTALTNEEQIQFFERQLEILVKKKNVIRDINSTYSIIGKIYDNPITDAKNAIIFFLENLYAKHSQSKQYASLIRGIHQSILFNFKIVLAIASGTQERLNRINRIINCSSDLEDKSFIRVGETEKGINKIIQWYKDNPFDILRIIDPYFNPEDLHIIKTFFDINNNLRVSILTHKSKDQSLDCFQTGWNKISADMTGALEVITVSFKENPDKCPIHDRWWVLFNNETSESIGLRLESLSGFGKRDSEISEMTQDAVEHVHKIWYEYVFNRKPKAGTDRLVYDDIKIK